MALRNKLTYKVDHPKIKEITVGDHFDTYCGETLVFTGLWDRDEKIGYAGGSRALYPFDFETKDGISKYFLNKFLNNRYNINLIKRKIIPLKEKIDLL